MENQCTSFNLYDPMHCFISELRTIDYFRAGSKNYTSHWEKIIAQRPTMMLMTLQPRKWDHLSLNRKGNYSSSFTIITESKSKNFNQIVSTNPY